MDARGDRELNAFARRIGIVFVALAIAACATVPRSVEIPRERLESALARRFPFETRAGDLFAIKVSAPRLQLLPDDNRLRLDFTVEMQDRIVRNAVRGEVAMSFGLRYEPSDLSIRLANVRTERFELQGVPERWRAPLELAGTQAAQQLLADATLHRFRPEDVERAQGFTPGEIRVTPTGVRVTLLPPVSP